jgi:hypothetical protein
MKGVSLFLLPRRLDDGSLNHYRIIRLKDKLGTRSMASGEIRLEGAVAYLVGEAGRGFVQMADMVNNSRLSNGVRAAGLMRRAVAEAEFIASERRAFGRTLEQMPLMQRQLDKLRLPAEQARTMVCQTALALARSDAGESDAYALLRILTPLIKFRACRDARKVTGDAMEVRGGCGYIEEWSDARLVRDAHLGSIWEGTSNIVALDVIRAVKREGSLPVLRAHCEKLLDDAALAPGYAKALRDALARAAALTETAAREGGDVLARQAASALYHCTSAIAMAWEAAHSGSAPRLRWSQLVLLHRVLPRDPLSPDAMPADWNTATTDRNATRWPDHLCPTKEPETPMKRSTFLLAACAATLLPLLPAAHAADAFPSKPLTLVIPFPPGGPTDAMARTLAAEMKDRLGQPMIVENRAGAGGNIGAEYVARAEADGHTLLFGTSGPLAINKSLYRKINYDPVKSFAPVIQVGYLPNILVVNPGAGEEREGTGGLCQGQPGQAELCLVGQRRVVAPGGRAVQLRGRHRPAAHPVQGHGPGAQRPAGQPGEHDLHRHPHRAALRQGRQAARAGRGHRRALAGAARRADHFRAGLQGLRRERVLRHRRAGRHARRTASPSSTMPSPRCSTRRR